LRLRRLVTGKDEADCDLTGDEMEQHKRVVKGISEIRATGNLKGLPVVIVHGRCDAILPPNHTSRAYAALNSIVEEDSGNLRYYEVTNAHHIDAFNTLEGFNNRYIPLHYYFLQTIDIMYDHLKRGAPLPQSQVVRTKPRGIDEDGMPKPIEKKNVPLIILEPSETDRIHIKSGDIRIPD
jgi:hydroxybutyrate-dimer hydrolase